MNEKIMIVDDDQDIREVIQVLLSSEGYNVIEASNGKEALELVDDDTDLIILDVMMPEMDGFETLAKIREFSDVKVAFITATRDYDTIEKARKLGVEDYLTKPFLPAVFLETIHGIID